MLPYVVQPGDTLLRIAKRFEVNTVSLLAANPRLSPAVQLAPGLLLFVPSQTVTFYCVQPGDRILKVAEQFSLPMHALLAANPHIDPKQLVVGQLLSIPSQAYPSIVDPRAEYGPAELVRDAALLEETYPFLEVTPIGASVLGKPLLAFRLGEGPVKVHVNAAMHANEWITAPILMTFMEEVAGTAATGGTLLGCDVRLLLEKVTLWCVPMVNPDGVELVQEGLRANHPYYSELLRWNRGSRRFSKWKANIRGVDLNDQFPAFWEEEVKRRAAEGPGPRDYPGTAPLTEPEARALAELTKSEQFDLTVALHTQGQEIYWNYRGYEPAEAEGIASQLGRASGYKPVKLTGSDAGYKDWFIYEFRKPGFTVELGYGVNPLPIEAFDELYEEARPLLLQAAQAAASKSR